MYDFKIYKKTRIGLIEINQEDFDFSDIEVGGEFEEIQFLYLSWAKDDLIDGLSIHDFQAEIIEKIHNFCKIRLAIPPCISKKDVTKFLLSKKIGLSRIEFLQADLNQIWLRDSMPTFARKKKHKKLSQSRCTSAVGLQKKRIRKIKNRKQKKMKNGMTKKF